MQVHTSHMLTDDVKHRPKQEVVSEPKKGSASTTEQHKEGSNVRKMPFDTLHLLCSGRVEVHLSEISTILVLSVALKDKVV